MKLKVSLQQIIFFVFLSFLFNQKTFSQCLQIESILVDACDTGSDEGLNEMVRFKVGAAPINTSSLSVNWPNNSWQGLVQNATTQSKVDDLNLQITAAGGCGQLIQPTSGVLPANAKVILVTSFNFDIALNDFGSITEDIYIIFQDNASTTTGHFANYNSTSGLRTLSMSFGGGCSDSVTYQRSSLIDTSGNSYAENGATVNFTPSGIPSYVNNGCVAPVDIFSVDAGNSPISACAGATISLLGIAQGQQTVGWTAPSGSFFSSTTLGTNYTIDPTATGSITLTLNATNSCSIDKTDTVIVNVTSGTTPTFTAVAPICSGGSLSALPTTSNNSITGTWSPALDNTATKIYTFTPTVGQCATAATLTITVNPNVLPTFTAVSPICSGGSLSALPTTSNNSITGTWSPALDNTATKIYTFTPTVGQCATTATLTITVNPNVLPTFTAVSPICSGGSLSALPTTSNNSITGAWSPALDNTATKIYTFTPTAGQCATITTLTITVINNVITNQNYYLCINKAGLLIAPVTIDSNLSPSQYSFAWTFNGNPISATTSSYPASTLGIYKVIATDLSGGCVKILIADVKESNEATAAATVGTDFDNQQEIIVTVTSGLGNYSYQLNDGLLQNSNIFSVSQGGEYVVNVIDNLGCNNFILDVTVLNYPRFFTPNGDGFHDTWNISGLPKPDKSVIFIYDRYGKLLKEIAPLGEGWDGIYNSHVLPATDYWFKILYQDVIGVNKEFKAHFSLKR